MPRVGGSFDLISTRIAEDELSLRFFLADKITSSFSDGWYRLDQLICASMHAITRE